MFKKLTLENFKNFKKAELHLGPFTILVGANATGKSNIREAFRFLHGIGRGYTIPDIIGQKHTSGERVWSGIRGGIKELVYLSKSNIESTFSLSLLDSHETKDDLFWKEYSIEVSPGSPNKTPRVISEQLISDRNVMFEAYIDPMGEVFMVRADPIEPYEFDIRWDVTKPVLLQMQSPLSHVKFLGYVVDFVENAKKEVATTVNILSSMRFFEFNPEMMRIPSFPGQTTLGDQGENLSSVLHAICQDEQKKLILTEWLRELTPMDATDFIFTPDQIGRILVTIVEKDGHKTSAYSASDGTLRFLGILAAFLGPNRPKFYFLEELENGIHPTRLHLLTQFIENQVAQGDIQVVATTHSPLLLNYLSQDSLKHASLLYRLEGHPDAHIKPIMTIPDARELIKKQGIMRLYESGWFEDMLYLLDDTEAMPDTEVPV
ncbi:hypothetical protein MNBD_CHLOROFLEXI01-1574 [hydrothermal vent metagenome]|uniref:ATPase AAA-type core domain-containing protein n=1 Tax=hydrothermal vent metagenome TaxID=652676 RepID=A0A3B0VDD9_9ZZZZ